MGDWVADGNVALLTDLYELTMAASYHANGLDEPATFDLFVRGLPPERNFLVACGLDDALDYLSELHFAESALEYLGTLGLFQDSFLDYLSELEFSGDVWAVPEGEAVFPNEPLLEVTAPLIQAQIVETALLNIVGFQTMVASKAVRVRLACADREFVDFSARRDHGVDAAVKAARASFVAGAAATSNVLAGQMYGIPVTGTMAHSYVMRYNDEYEAFAAFMRDFPTKATLLLDTYDTEEGARTAVRVARDLASEGLRPQAVRLDSGDLVELAKSVRRILDDGGLDDVRIFASGDLDEHRIADMLRQSAPVDAFGVGTQLGTSGDAPHLGVVYKLVEDVTGSKMKLSSGKSTLPGRKQVFRTSRDGTLVHDVVTVAGDGLEGKPVLEQVMSAGRTVGDRPALAELRSRCTRTLDSLPLRLRSLEPGQPPYEVRVSQALETVVASARADHWSGRS